MSNKLHEPLELRDHLREDSGEDAQTVRTFISRPETELRTRIAGLIAEVSERENWKLKQCAAVARHVEQISIEHLDTICAYFQARGEGHAQLETPAILADVLPASSQEVRTPVAELHDRLQTLETRVAGRPGIPSGIRGVRIMRVVALMSQARGAEIKGGVRAIYHHG